MYLLSLLSREGRQQLKTEMLKMLHRGNGMIVASKIKKKKHFCFNLFFNVFDFKFKETIELFEPQ